MSFIKKLVLLIVIFLSVSQATTGHSQASTQQVTHYGIALKSPTNVYFEPSTSSNILKSYSQGAILKYTSYSTDWYKATVYLNGKANTGYIHKSHVENTVENPETLYGIGLKSPTLVYSKASTNSKSLKSYEAGTILKYQTFTSNWYEATIYLNGKQHKGYIHKSHVENAVENPETLYGIGLKSPTLVYSKASTNSKSLKSYETGTILKYQTFTSNWYEATIYLNGKQHKGFIHKSHVENTVENPETLYGIGLKSPTLVYSKASTNSKSLKSYEAGTILKYQTFTSNWYEATVYLNGKQHKGYIHKSHVENLLEKRGQTLKGRALNSPTNVYSKASAYSTVLKSYNKGSILTIKTYSPNWYEVKVYLSGVATTGYIRVSDITLNDLINVTNYPISYSDFVNIQVNKSPKSDGAGKIEAPREEVFFYANPSNFPNGTKESFQYLVLSASAGVDYNEINEKVLYNKGILNGTGKFFIEAGKTYNLNEVYLVAHALHETGNGTSILAKGVPVDKDGIVTRDANGDIVNNSETVHTVYNMYGYGAKDTCPIDCGAKYAFDKGWFSIKDAIIGGAAEIGTKYIHAGQNTLYKMRWNPDNPGSHQYATHVAWSVLQTKKIYDIYKMLDHYSLVMDVPRFINQPNKTDIIKYPKHTYGITQTSGYLNLRNGPSTQDLVIDQIPNGTKLVVLGKGISGWYKVNYNGNIGWVSNNYVQLLNLLHITASDLYVRQTPNGSIMGQVSNQLVSAVLDSNNKIIQDNIWYKIYYSDKQYWVSGGNNGTQYVTIKK